MKSYFKIKNIDINNFKNELKNSNLLWKNKNMRGNWTCVTLKGYLGKEQKFLEKHDNSINKYYYTNKIKGFPSIKTFLEGLDTEIYLVRLLKIKKNSQISIHYDNYFDKYNEIIRCHIPIITNEYAKIKILNHFIQKNKNINESKFAWENGLKNNLVSNLHLQEGTMWYINVNLLHCVENLGDIDRIHLVIDMKPTQQILDNISLT